MAAPRPAFRALLAGAECLAPGSVFDPCSAVLAERAGYECAILAGSVASLVVLGAPDLILLTLSEFAEQARRICRVLGIPLMVDADHGYGNALNVMRSVVELEQAGVAALTIEDTELPRRFGTTRPGFISLDEGVGKVRAALAARRDPDLVIIGRTGAMEAGTEEALARIRAYAAAGADAVMLTGVSSREQIAAASRAVRVPILLGALPAALNDAAWLSSLGVRINIVGHQPYNTALQAAAETYAALRAGVKAHELPGRMPAERAALAERRDEYQAAIREFLGG